MSRIAAVSLGLGLGLASIASAVDGPRLDRPTPPAKCADGTCYPHPQTFGYFPTRWRTWQGMSAAPTPATAATPQIPGISPYEMPTPEKEEMRAPPMTKSAAEAGAAAGAAAPGGGTPPAHTPETSGLTPAPLGFPPTGAQPGAQPPAGASPFPTTSPLQPAGAPQSPLQRPQTAPLGGGQPMSDLDLPPSPRFAATQTNTPAVAPRTVSPNINRTPIQPRAATSMAAPRPALRGDDPPPPPPFALGGVAP